MTVRPGGKNLLGRVKTVEVVKTIRDRDGVDHAVAHRLRNVHGGHAYFTQCDVYIRHARWHEGRPVSCLNCISQELRPTIVGPI